jgi:hypothetical protein
MAKLKEAEVQAKTMLPLSEFNELAAAAKEADRSIAAEIRVALRKHLQGNGPSAPLTEADARAATKGV